MFFYKTVHIVHYESVYSDFNLLTVCFVFISVPFSLETC